MENCQEVEEMADNHCLPIIVFEESDFVQAIKQTNIHLITANKELGFFV